MANRNRTAGNGWERTIVHKLKNVGYEHASTSRLESRSRDALKIDITNKKESINGRIPYNIQCKNCVGKIDYHKIMAEMPNEQYPSIIVHNYTEKKGTRFITQGQYAIVKLETLLELIKK